MRVEGIEADAVGAAFGAEPMSRARIHVDWLKWATLFGFWALFSFLNANQVYFEMLHKPGMHHSWWRIVFWQLAVWGVWGCLTPLILGLGRKVTGANASWLRGLLIHLPFSLLLRARPPLPQTPATHPAVGRGEQPAPVSRAVQRRAAEPLPLRLLRLLGRA